MIYTTKVYIDDEHFIDFSCWKKKQAKKDKCYMAAAANHACDTIQYNTIQNIEKKEYNKM